MNEFVQEIKTNTKLLFFSYYIKMKEKLVRLFSFVSVTKKLIALDCFSPNFSYEKDMSDILRRVLSCFRDKFLQEMVPLQANVSIFYFVCNDIMFYLYSYKEF